MRALKKPLESGFHFVWTQLVHDLDITRIKLQCNLEFVTTQVLTFPLSVPPKSESAGRISGEGV